MEVPGGAVGIDSCRGGGEIGLIARNIAAVVARGGFNARGVLRDVVVLDESRRVLYREGPYDGINVRRPFQRIVSETREGGVEAFMRSKQVAEARVGPVSITSGRVTLLDVVGAYLTAIKSSLFRTRR